MYTRLDNTDATKKPSVALLVYPPYAEHIRDQHHYSQNLPICQLPADTQSRYYYINACRSGSTYCLYCFLVLL